MSALTERQERAWPEAVSRLREYNSGVPRDIRSWDVTYSEETRPGRGHYLNATFVDGEVFAQILMDVHGYPSISIASLEWMHADANEECDCDSCQAVREADA